MNRNRFVSGVVSSLVFMSALSAFGQGSADVRELKQQAQDLARSEKYDEAVALMKKVVEAAPNDDLALAILSDYEFKARKYPEGLGHAQKAIKINDKVGVYYTLAASNSWGNQDIDRAREYCDVVLKGGAGAFGAAAVRDARVIMDMLVPKKYTLTWNLDPRKAKAVSGAVAIAMPKSDLPYQTSTYEIDGVKNQRLVKGAVNDVLNVVPQGDKPITLVMKVTVLPYSYKKELAKDPAGKKLPSEVLAFVGPSELINPKSPVLVKVVAGLKGANNAETVRNILVWMKKNIAYKLKTKDAIELDFKNVDEILERGHAECRGYAMLFTALCRAAGIPARSVWGMARPAPGADNRFGAIASHNWSEFYVPGTGWVPVDPQAPESIGFLSTRCIRIFMDVKRSRTSTELLPMYNLTNMLSEPIKVEEAR